MSRSLLNRLRPGTPTMTPLKVAVLDDYHQIAPEHFSRLPASDFEISYFPDTLLPYNHPSTPASVKSQLVARLQPFSIIACIRERTPFPAALLEQLPNLKLLQSTAGRNKGIDLDACTRLGIRVAGTTGLGRSDEPRSQGAPAGPDSTTQHCVALILGLARNLAGDDATVKAGGWQTAFATGLAGKTLGVVGLGRLGANVAKIMSTAFGMRVVAWSENLTQAAADGKAAEAGLPSVAADGSKTFEAVGKEELFRRADVVSLHYVLSERSRGIVGRAELALMKPSALLVNTARAALVVEEELLAVLEAGGIRGAALDVFELEPLPLDSAWRSAEWGRGGRSRVLLTPHMGYVEEEVMRNWSAEVVENIERFVAGEELNCGMA